MRISRKQFLRRSSFGLLGTGILFGKSRLLFPDRAVLQKITLGKTGIETTRLGFGATRTDQPAVLRYALDMGINFIDTGRHYAQGKNEEMVSRVIRGVRKEVVIQSKVRSDFVNDVQQASDREISEAVEKKFWNSLHESLKVLHTDYIDVYLLHNLEKPELLFHEAVVQAFIKARQEGKVRAIGFSTHKNQAQLIRMNAEKKVYDVVMTAFNHRGGFVHSRSDHTEEWDHEELIAVLKTASADTGIVAMKTCSGGPYSPDGSTPASIPRAVKWICEQEYIHAVMPAMANFSEIDEHIQTLKTS